LKIYVNIVVDYIHISVIIGKLNCIMKGNKFYNTRGQYTIISCLKIQGQMRQY